MYTYNFEYKSHIDSLRAIAVFFVIFFHLNNNIFQGGYLGVDIFFVISGYVITQLFCKQIHFNNKIEIIGFYIRRFLRIYPLLICVLLVTLFFYIFFGYLNQSERFFKSLITSLFAVSNLYYIKIGDDYFLQEILNPLLHTWSLGVEEQFYLIYPILLFILIKFKNKLIDLKKIGIIILFFSIISLLTNLNHDFNNFFLPTARFWQIGIGCFLFFINFKIQKKIINILLVQLSLVFLIILFFFPIKLNESILISQILITLITCFLIIGGLNLNNYFLKNKLLIFFGKISFSLYLWHLPIFYFADIYLNGYSFYIYTIILLFSLSSLSYLFIENKFRYLRIKDQHFFTSLVLITLLFFILFYLSSFSLSKVNYNLNTKIDALGKDIIKYNYLENNFSLASRSMPNWSINGNKIFENCSINLDVKEINLKNINTDCIKTKNTSKNLFILSGDSHAAHFANTFDNSKLINNLYFSRLHPCYFIGLNECNNKRRWLKNNQAKGLVNSFDNIYYFMSWDNYDIFNLRIDDLKINLENYINSLDDSVTFILIPPTPKFLTHPKICVFFKTNCTVIKKNDLLKRQNITNLFIELSIINNNTLVYDPYNFICPKNECIIYDHDNDFLMYMDEHHLSVEGSKFLTKDLDNWIKNNLSDNIRHND